MPWLMNRSTWVVIVCLALVAGVVWYGETRYTAGYNARTVDDGEARDQELSAALKVTERTLNTVIRARESELSQARQLLQSLQEREPEVVEREVVKYLRSDSCTRFGPEFVELWQAIHGPGPGTASDSNR